MFAPLVYRETAMNILTTLRAVAIAACAAIVVSCGGPELTVKTALETDGPAALAMLKAMKNAAASLPASPADVTATAAITPAPGFTYADYMSANTAFLRVERLSGGTGLLQADIFSDYRYGADWRETLESADPAVNSRDEAALAADGMSLRNRLRGALAMRYAVLLRLKSFMPATIVDVATFDGGAAVFEAFLLDLGSGRLLAGCTVTAEPDATVNFKHPADATQDQIDKTLLANAEATMSLDAMRKLSACLTEKTGGAFKLN